MSQHLAAYYRSLRPLDTIENVHVDVLEYFENGLAQKIVKTIATAAVAQAALQATLDSIHQDAVTNNRSIRDINVLVVGANLTIITQYYKYA